MEENQEQEESQEWEVELSEYKALLRHKGWKRLEKWIQGQIELRERDFRKPLKAMDETLEQEFLKGELAGLELVPKFLEARVEILAEEMQAKLEEQEHGPREQSREPESDQYIEF